MKKLLMALALICEYAVVHAQVISKFPNEAYYTDEGFYKGVSVALNGLPIQPSRTISFTTDEGSYMNLDLSPDGKTIIFDLLADIYTLPVSGGKTTQLTRGLALHYRPRWSPDGTKFAYLSDESGAYQIHIRNLDGTFHKAIGLPRFEFFTALQQHFEDSINWSSNNLFVNGHPITGGSETFSDTAVIQPEPVFQQQIHKKLLSANGQYAVFIKDTNGTKALMLADLSTGENKLLVTSLLKDSQYRTTTDPDPGFCISGDSKYVYISYRGKIHRITLQTGKDDIIPFQADVKVDMGPLLRNRFPLNYDSVKGVQVHSPDLSPDGKRIAYSTLNKIYVKELATDRYYAVAQQNANQYQPVFSPDGKWIAYVSWNDREGGFLWKVSAMGGRPEQLTKIPGVYQRPVWSPDGKSIAFMRGAPALSTYREYNNTDTVSLEILELKTGKSTTIDRLLPFDNAISFSADGTEIIYKPGDKIKRDTINFPPFPPIIELIAKSIKTGATREIVKGNYASMLFTQSIFNQTSISPDNNYLVFSSWENIYLMPLRKEGLPLYLPGYDPLGQAMVRIGRGVDPRWEEDGKMLTWGYGNKYYRIETSKIIDAIGKRTTPKEYAELLHEDDFLSVAITPEEIDLSVSVPANYGKGVLAITNARLITMEENTVIEKGTIVIKDGRIAAIGAVDSIAIPQGARVMDMKGTTLMPGIMDLHDHMTAPPDIYPQQDSRYLLNLANGITTAADPAYVYLGYGYSDLLKTGQMLGPRLFNVGVPVYVDAVGQVTTPRAAREIVVKRKQMGSILVKQYILPSRLQRQWLLQACREEGLNMTNEGGLTGVFEQIGMIKDGSTGVEHSPSWGDVYNDVIKLYAHSNTYLTPTLQVVHSQYGLNAIETRSYFMRHYWDTNAIKLKKFLVDTQKRIFHYKGNDSLGLLISRPAAILARIKKEGGLLVVGSHGGSVPGTEAQDELWSLCVKSGLTNMEALQIATIDAATGIGLDGDLGSLKAGKIADLIILNKNPLDDIHNTKEIRYVMKDGILYNADTLDEIWPQVKKLEFKLR